MLFLRARYYEPGTGRFLSKDPGQGNFKWPGTLHEWNYVLNNPARFSDPLGLQASEPTPVSGVDGSKIHTMVQNYYKMRYPHLQLMGEYEFLARYPEKLQHAKKEGVKASSDPLGFYIATFPPIPLAEGRPDLIALANHTIYEIKHHRDLSKLQGVAEAMWYIERLNDYETSMGSGIVWGPGSDLNREPKIIGRWPTGPEAYVFAEQKWPGLITYWKRDKKDEEERRENERSRNGCRIADPQAELELAAQMQIAAYHQSMGVSPLWMGEGFAEGIMGGASTAWSYFASLGRTVFGTEILVPVLSPAFMTPGPGGRTYEK